MDKKTLKSIMHFLEKEDNKSSVKWKLLNNEPLMEDELTIEGDLDLNHLNITSLPEGLKVGGDLDLINSYIESLPKGLKVGGDLNLLDSEIRFLPEGLEVGGDLNLENTNIIFLPKGLQVGSSLYIGDTPLTKYSYDELREMVKPGFIKGYINR